MYFVFVYLCAWMDQRETRVKNGYKEGGCCVSYAFVLVLCLSLIYPVFTYLSEWMDQIQTCVQNGHKEGASASAPFVYGIVLDMFSL